MLGTNIGIDLGTTSILIFVEGKGIVVSEPSTVAFDTDTGRLLAVGQKAADRNCSCRKSVPYSADGLLR